ncbi:hypothetical protein CEXT_31441 [Caerostris extrusa]|uniref:Uncharacterized protein n=1 Tax=Caerostris extrusa TaxID=172846 RepID=A0AAV4T3I0_CAEEX|nr:hypothetical protein CEXT_31441 [Caerostris extrusa]
MVRDPVTFSRSIHQNQKLKWAPPHPVGRVGQMASCGCHCRSFAGQGHPSVGQLDGYSSSSRDVRVHATKEGSAMILLRIKMD